MVKRYVSHHFACQDYSLNFIRISLQNGQTVYETSKRYLSIYLTNLISQDFFVHFLKLKSVYYWFFNTFLRDKTIKQ